METRYHPDELIHRLSMFHVFYPAAVRVWHWITFLAISASLITVLLASTMFRTQRNVAMVQEQVQAKGGTVSPLQARAVAHEYSDKLWDVHRYIGFGLCFLLLSRIVIEMALSKEQRLIIKIKRALKLERGSRPELNDRRHYIFVKTGYLIFYLLLFIMVVTGLGLAFEDVPFLRTNHRRISGIHSFTQYLVYLYILVHITGVLIAEFTLKRGIVSAMINGGARQDKR